MKRRTDRWGGRVGSRRGGPSGARGPRAGEGSLFPQDPAAAEEAAAEAAAAAAARQQDPEAAIVAMAAQLLHFFESEMARGASV